MTIKQEFYRLTKDVWHALKQKEIMQVLLFMLFTGIITPSYSNITYYFLTDEIGISKLMLGFLVVSIFVTTLIGSIIYNYIFKAMEFRYMIFAA